MRPLKILYVSSMILSPEKPVLNPVLQQQADALRTKGHVVDTLFIKSFISKFYYLSLIPKVFFKTLIGNYDIVHAHYGLSAIATTCRWKTPLVLTLHGSDALLGKVQPAISRFYSQYADATIGVSDKIVNIIPRCDYIPCGVDLDLFQPQDRLIARKRLGLKQDMKYILFPYSSLRKVKRYDIAQQTIDILKNNGVNVELITIANQPSSEMVHYYNASDAMIMCSDSEGSPTAVKEALACNIPVISVDVGDTGAIMKGVNAAKLYEQNAKQLALGFKKLFEENPDTRWQSSNLMKRFSLQNTANQIVEVYQRVLGISGKTR